MPAGKTTRPPAVIESRQNEGREYAMALNYLGIFFAALAAWLLGAAWYGVLRKQWVAALGWTADDVKDASGKRKMPIGAMVTAFVALLIMAAMLSGIMVHTGGHTVRIGAISGALVWFGFVITTQTVNYAFQKRKPVLNAIDGGHWLAVLIMQGIVLGVLG